MYVMTNEDPVLVKRQLHLRCKGRRESMQTAEMKGAKSAENECTSRQKTNKTNCGGMKSVFSFTHHAYLLS
jgi:hypothetical protein